MSGTFKHHVGRMSLGKMDLTEQMRAKIVGLSWKKLRGEVPLTSLENVDDSPPAKNLRPRGINGTPLSAQRENGGEAGEKKFLKRARSVRLMKDAFGTLKQVRQSTKKRNSTPVLEPANLCVKSKKLRVTNTKHKRLLNNSPYGHPRTPRTPITTPRRGPGCGTKMYSPFTIDTPANKRTTPRNIRMGVHAPRRCNFGSPNDYNRKLKSVEDGVRELCDLGKRMDVCIQKRDETEAEETARRTRSSTGSLKISSPVFV